MWHPLEISRSKTKTQPWKLQIFFLYTPRNSTSFLIDPWNFPMLLLQYPLKFHVLKPHLCLDFFWNSPFLGVQAKNLFINWKLCVSIEEWHRAHPKNCQEMPNIYQNLDRPFSHLKIVYIMLRLEIFPVFDSVFTANILRMWEKREGGSSLVSRYENTAVV